MSNKSIFKTPGIFTPKADTVNEAGGHAYKLSPKQALAQYAATGCFNNTFYADATEQLDSVLESDGRRRCLSSSPKQLFMHVKRT